jgi:hypothetical protein
MLRNVKPHSARMSWLTQGGTVLIALTFVGIPSASAQTSGNVVVVEEHWELQIAQP